MSETKKKRKLSFNVFDVFVILLVVILIGAVVYRIYQANASDAKKSNTVYTIAFECQNEYSSLENYLNDGEAVYIKSTRELLGYIYKDAKEGGVISIIEKPTEAAPTESTTEKAGEVVTEETTEEKEYDKLYTKENFEGKMKLNGNAEKSRDGAYYIIEKLNITVGSSIDVYTQDAEFTITVKEFIEKD